MATIEPSAFLPVLRRHITGPLDVWMLDAVGEAAIEFCRQSELICQEKVVAGADAGTVPDLPAERGRQFCRRLGDSGDGYLCGCRWCRRVFH